MGFNENMQNNFFLLSYAMDIFNGIFSREQIRSETIIFILIFQTGKKWIFRPIFVRLNLIEYFEAIVFLCLTHQIDKEKVPLHRQCHFYENCT